MTTTTLRLIDHQRAAMAFLTEAADAGCDGASAAELAEAVGTHVNGVSATAGSLIRRGLVERYRKNGHVHYRLARS